MERLDLSGMFGRINTPPERGQLGRLVLFVFFVTYSLTRSVIAFDMLRNGPAIYLRDGGTHIHHFVYGIGLLSLVGGYLLFGNPVGMGKWFAAFFYGIGLALAFDEFGMWLKLRDVYWQRISYEMISVITGLLAFIAFCPKPKPAGRRSWWQILVLGGACVLLSLSLISLFGLLRDHYGLRLREAEETMQEAAELPQATPRP